MSQPEFDAVVVGAGPNGLSAAIELARSGFRVCVLEAEETPGGGARTEALTLPGFIHDVCSAIHPMAAVSPFFKSLPLEPHGVRWIHPPIALAHPLQEGSAAVLYSSLSQTAVSLGRDAASYEKLLSTFVQQSDRFFSNILKPIRVPSDPWLLFKFGWRGLLSADALIQRYFQGSKARALFAGCAAHSLLALDDLGSSSFAIPLMVAAHAVGWPLAEGGSQTVIQALIRYLESLGGLLRTGTRVKSMGDIPSCRVTLLDTTPAQLVQIARSRLPGRYCKKLSKFKHGPGVFKIDWALDAPIPWIASECGQAGTVHVGGSAEEIARSEKLVATGQHSENPFVIVAQPSLFDSTRAPAGKHVAWGYCHVPNGSDRDMTEAIEGAIERFAPGFRDRIIARHTISAVKFQSHNANMIGGDIGGGSNRLPQFLLRPALQWNPYTTANPDLFLCSSSTPPGAGVHGMCGYWAARTAIRRLRALS